MTTQEVADKLVSLCRQGKNMDAIQELYADSIVSYEPVEAVNHPTVTEGKEAVIQKSIGFFESVEEFHASTMSDPTVVGNYFTVTASMDVTFKGMGRMQMTEVCVYRVVDGKVVEEKFFF